MKQYIVSSTAFLPDGGTAVGSAWVEIADHQIAALSALINSLGTIDVGELNLEEEMPVLYDILREACEVATTPAVEAYYLRKFFDEGEIDYNVDDVMQTCWDMGIYTLDAGVDNSEYEQDPSQALMDRDTYNRIYFEDWLPGYIDSLDDQQLIDFMADVMEYGMEDLGEWTFTIEVPDIFKQ